MPKRSRTVAEEVYWTPPEKGESFTSPTTPPPVVEHEYYIPPQSPQEAIDRGIVASVAVKPKTFLPHEKRLAPSYRPRHWHCWWGCEGQQSYIDKNPKPNHDYYCPYWELLQLFPEWEEDFSYKLVERPPKPREM